MRIFFLFGVLFFQFRSLAQLMETDYHCRRDIVISQSKYGSVYITYDHNDCVNQTCFQEFKFDTIDVSRLKFLD